MTEEEEAAAERLVLPSGAPRPGAAAQVQQSGPQPQQQDAEADPFGLDEFLAKQGGAAAVAAPDGVDGGGGEGAAAPARLTWDHAELAVMMAQALLECVQT